LIILDKEDLDIVDLPVNKIQVAILKREQSPDSIDLIIKYKISTIYKIFFSLFIAQCIEALIINYIPSGMDYRIIMVEQFNILGLDVEAKNERT
jgi:hypothetical protein